MAIQRALYESLWSCSYEARAESVESRQSITEVFPDGHGLGYRGFTTPEEVTTYNWLRNLVAHRRARGLPIAVSVHSRALEGGNKRTGRRPSGADIELALELWSGEWVDLLLQAKRLYRSAAGQGVYEGWKNSQVLELRQWAREQGDRSPGMLLYNSDINPFAPVGTSVMQGACHVRHVELSDDKLAPTGPHISSPLGITIAMLPRLPQRIPRALSGDQIPADVVNRHAFPLECLQCAFVPSNETSEAPHLALASPPSWALAMLASVDAYRGEVAVDSVPVTSGRPGYSVALPLDYGRPIPEVGRLYLD